MRNYSIYAEKVKEWWSKEVNTEWAEHRVKAMALLKKEAELQEIVQLVGPDALPERERITLEGARVIREDFLQQNAFHEVDSFCSPKKQFKMLKIMIHFYDKCLEAVTRGLPAKQIAELEVKDDIARLKYVEEDKIDDAIAEIEKKIEEQINELATKLGGM